MCLRFRGRCIFSTSEGKSVSFDFPNGHLFHGNDKAHISNPLFIFSKPIFAAIASRVGSSVGRSCPLSPKVSLPLASATAAADAYGREGSATQDKAGKARFRDGGDKADLLSVRSSINHHWRCDSTDADLLQSLVAPSKSPGRGIGVSRNRAEGGIEGIRYKSE